MEISLELVVLLLNVDAHTDSNEQKSASDYQNDYQRAHTCLLIWFEGLGRSHGVTRLLNYLPVVSIEANLLMLGVSEVEHHVVVAEESVSY